MKILTGLLFLCALLALSQAADVREELEIEETFHEALLPEAEAGNWTEPADVENEPAAEENAAQAADDLLRSSCPAGWLKFNHRCFIFIPRAMTWARAQRNCVSLQATLASVHNFEEYHCIQRLIIASTHISPQTWIGGSDAQEERLWLWSDGSPFHYSNWCSGEPNNYKNQHCLQMNYGGSKCWDDVWCSENLPSICAKNI
ncbi:hypothetical protein ATANTOWER_024677 [Ataeniobius toweri]|uniref:C-type lectin domain-containing protein n=1 Tax=Ataeniobius toweri TaxID=208326 RepID=A0ABU7C236_9TELE|nr:hypothetical protein [Ataeniobius toweri]